MCVCVCVCWHRAWEWGMEETDMVIWMVLPKNLCHCTNVYWIPAMLNTLGNMGVNIYPIRSQILLIWPPEYLWTLSTSHLLHYFHPSSSCHYLANEMLSNAVTVPSSFLVSPVPCPASKEFFFSKGKLDDPTTLLQTLKWLPVSLRLKVELLEMACETLYVLIRHILSTPVILACHQLLEWSNPYTTGPLNMLFLLSGI